MKKALLAMMMLAVTLSAAPARADVAYQPAIGFGAQLALDEALQVIANGTYVMVLDLDNDGWSIPYTAQTPGAPFDNASSWQWDAQDLVMDRGQISDGSAFPSYNFVGDPTVSIPNYQTTDHWYLMWFNKPFNLADVGPGEGIWYGVEDMGTAAPNGFTLTPDSNGGQAVFHTISAGVPVPEPVSTVLALIGGGAMVLRRRFVGNA